MTGYRDVGRVLMRRRRSMDVDERRRSLQFRGKIQSGNPSLSGRKGESVGALKEWCEFVPGRLRLVEDARGFGPLRVIPS